MHVIHTYSTHMFILTVCSISYGDIGQSSVKVGFMSIASGNENIIPYL